MGDGSIKVGDILAGKYRVERGLGHGAMGIVLAARSIDLGRPCAIKLILAHGAMRKHQEEARARFLREARAAAMLSSMHAVKIWDTGTLEGGEPFMVMELLDGKDLAAVLREGGPLPVEDAVTYVLQACEVVAEAHAHGIVHRDLKPANLFLTKGFDGAPIVKVVDFGISKLEADAVHLTATREILGSPLYLSPEGFRGRW
jgi:serine/threonine protein kinase